MADALGDCIPKLLDAVSSSSLYQRNQCTLKAWIKDHDGQRECRDLYVLP